MSRPPAPLHPPTQNGSAPDGPSLADVVRAKHASNANGADKKARKAYNRALLDFKRSQQGPNVQVGVFGTGGVFITGHGEFHFVTNGSERHFDSLEAEGIIYRINDVAERAKDWWRADPEVRWWEQPQTNIPLWRWLERRRLRRSCRRERSIAAEREPHLGLAYTIATAAYAAVAEENVRRGPRPTDAPVPADRAASEAFLRNVAALHERVVHAEKLFVAAAQRDAQSLYARGMLFGMIAVAAVYGGVWELLHASGVSQASAIAFPCGAVGALVSVLQRMTAGKLVLDFTAGKSMLVWLGAGRPWIGGILGMALYTFVKAGLLPLVPADAVPLAFFAATGFLAGFNERFAQDMIAGSTLALKNDDKAERPELDSNQRPSP